MEDPYEAHLNARRAAREAELAAEDGWLTVVGLEWLEAGPNRIGAAEDNDIVLSGGPAYLGTVTVGADGAAHIVLSAPGIATIDGRDILESHLADTSERPHDAPVVRFGPAGASLNFHVVDRDGRKGLRVKDNGNPARTGFRGLHYFPIDPAWCIDAAWVPLVPPRQIEVGTTWGNVSTKVATHKAVFPWGERSYELFPVPSQKSDLVFVLADRTSGKETYGACRFLTGELLGKDTIRLDFNNAINPPCAFSAFATCPIAPPENRLTLRITAGEKTYRYVP